MDTAKLFLAGLAAIGAGFTLFSAARPAPKSPSPSPSGPPPSTRSGGLYAIDKEGRPTIACPLKHTAVQADISGFLGRVTVTQEFENTGPDKIEAVYVFPLPNKAAVDDMTMLVGDRTIKGKIKRREEAKEIFERARQQGHTASLLDQERPNIFTQSVTNIGPGMKVKITISYVETLAYEAGSYEFVFPMVVGPRYIPANLPDAARVTPPVAKPNTRAGHDISLKVNVDAGVPIDAVSSDSHAVDMERPNRHTARVWLRNQAELPNRDFILRYKVAGGKVEDAVLSHRGDRGGFFTLILQPPARVAANEITPKEIVFVVDTSGSMHGFPLDRCKELIKMSLDGLHPRDTFNLITFSGDEHILFPRPVPATAENVREAQRFMLSREGRGGTEMMKAIRAALDPTDSQDHVRVVVFLTDGYVGNDMQIIGEVKRHANARVFSFGIGSSVNRFLLDKMAEEGRGEVEYVGIGGDAGDDAHKAVKRLYERVRTPVMTDISVDWNGLPVSDVYPKRFGDLFSAKPVVIHGRYTGAAQGTARLRGKVAGREVVREIPVAFAASQPANDVLATLWARTRIEDLMGQDWAGTERGGPKADVKEQVTQLGLDYRLMTQFTSFVAVEESTAIKGGIPQRVEVPVEMPHGVSYDRIFGKEKDTMSGQHMVMSAPMSAMPGSGGGFLGGLYRSSRAEAIPAPPPSPKVVEPVARIDKSKLDTALAAMVQAGATSKVAVKIWLSDDSATVIAELRKLGVEITAQRPGKLVLAKVKPADLAKITRMAAVLHIGQDLGQP